MKNNSEKTNINWNIFCPTISGKWEIKMYTYDFLWYFLQLYNDRIYIIIPGQIKKRTLKSQETCLLKIFEGYYLFNYFFFFLQIFVCLFYLL